MRQSSLAARLKNNLGMLGLLATPLAAEAGFTEDSHLKLDLKNFYLYRNFTESDAPRSQVGDWSQGFDLQYVSGYTDTPLAVGLDIDAQYAGRLDSHGNDGSLLFSQSEQQAQSYGRSGATFKARYARTELKVGDMRPELPIAYHDVTRQLDTIFQGAVLESKDIDGLTLTGGRFWSAVTRESSDHEKFYRFNTDRHLNSDGMDFAGATYDFPRGFQASYFYAVVHDLYRQQYLGLRQDLELGAGYRLRLDLRGFANREDGEAKSGEIDNRALSTGATLLKGGHKVSLGYQHQYGDSMFPLLNGYIPQFYLLNWASQPFVYAGEDSWALGYAYDFSAAGLPGLKLIARYVRGSDFTQDKVGVHAQETERDFFLRYVVQQGPLKGLGFEWKNFLVRQHNFGSSFEENRLITTYTWKFW